MKDRQLLLTFLNNLFQKQLIKIDRKEVCQMVNKYFEGNVPEYIGTLKAKAY